MVALVKVYEIRIVKECITFDSLLIRSDGGTLDANVVLLDGQSRVNGDLVVRGITVGQAQIIVQSFHIHIRKNKLNKRASKPISNLAFRHSTDLIISSFNHDNYLEQVKYVYVSHG